MGAVDDGIHFKSLKKCFIAEEYSSELCYFAPKLFHITILSGALCFFVGFFLRSISQAAACVDHICVGRIGPR